MTDWDKPVSEMTRREILSIWGVPEMFQDIYENAATVEEMRLALAAGAEGYMTGRTSGLSHDDVMDATRARLPMGQYSGARMAGATHEELLAAVRPGIDFGAYSNARTVGASDSDFYAAATAGIDQYDYAQARAVGATHDEVMAAHAAGTAMDEYAFSREGQNHAAAMSAALKRRDP